MQYTSAQFGMTACAENATWPMYYSTYISHTIYCNAKQREYTLCVPMAIKITHISLIILLAIT